ncbi:unnamed protein product [Cylindrotheca closterium]|uniref:Fatty acid hydroxylase domain-containing protein n=1 Tax=Cylindrotheca closterium TaxID=2856 RepID=A0AAD2FGH1_9STRA|nr:unnamed protein product [Cylindrotheca closterium]
MSTILEYFSKGYQNLRELQQSEDYVSLNASIHTIVFYTLILTVVLEVWSLPTLQLLWNKQPNGRELYAKALFWNIFNQYALAIPLYSVVGTFMTRNDDYHYYHDNNAMIRNLVEVVWILGGHAVGYYHVHKAFHLSPKWYKYHKFHHRFNSYVPPSAANAVEPVEYILAYLLPFVVTLALWPPFFTPKIHRHNVSMATLVISVLNLLVHTPKLEQKYLVASTTTSNNNNNNNNNNNSWTRWFVSTEDHLNHHRKLKCHYASPTFNVDNIVDDVKDAWSSATLK